jgi:hypothetical protein
MAHKTQSSCTPPTSLLFAETTSSAEQSDAKGKSNPMNKKETIQTIGGLKLKS